MYIVIWVMHTKPYQCRAASQLEMHISGFFSHAERSSCWVLVMFAHYYRCILFYTTIILALLI